MKILGISCFYHDSGIALIEDGEILFAAQEERYSRINMILNSLIKQLIACLGIGYRER